MERTSEFPEITGVALLRGRGGRTTIEVLVAGALLPPALIATT
jgi:hypothetical protein